MTDYEAEVRNFVSDYVKEKDWKRLLSYGNSLKVTDKSKYLWAWPSESDLKYLRDTLTDCGINNVLSIGCGCGLLEWIINESTDLNVIGVEIDNGWWSSKYCAKPFIPLKFCTEILSDEFLNECMPSTIAPKFALLFCYFNNGPAFTDYVKHYRGDTIVIIGPETGHGRTTDPLPFAPNFSEACQWNMIGSHAIGTNNDFIVIYRRGVAATI